MKETLLLQRHDTCGLDTIFASWFMLFDSSARRLLAHLISGLFSPGQANCLHEIPKMGSSEGFVGFVGSVGSVGSEGL